MNLNELAKSIRFDNASKGFDPTEGGVGRYLLLTVSEICEAQNELRDGHSPTHIYYSTNAGYGTERNHGDSKPEGFPVEIADAIIRILDIGAKLGTDFSTEVSAPDYSTIDFTIDDWLLGVCHCLSMANSYEPKESEFHVCIKQALGSLFMLCERHKIMIMDVITEKLAFNRSRPPKHGRKF